MPVRRLVERIAFGQRLDRAAAFAEEAVDRPQARPEERRRDAAERAGPPKVVGGQDPQRRGVALDRGVRRRGLVAEPPGAAAGARGTIKTVMPEAISSPPRVVTLGRMPEVGRPAYSRTAS